MAIWHPAPGSVVNVVIDGVLYSKKTLNSPSVRQANNNRGRKTGKGGQSRMGSSSKFTMLDNQITNLDATFDVLPNQETWNEYAGDVAGAWQLCANCAPESTGKKVFRQINFNRQLIGLSPLTTPPGSPQRWTALAMSAKMTVKLSTHVREATLGWASWPRPGWVVSQCGNVQSNPFYQLNLAERGGVLKTGPGYQWCEDMVDQLGLDVSTVGGQTMAISGCTFDDAGNPSNKILIQVQTQVVA